MDKYRIIDIVTAGIATLGLIYQVLSDVYLNGHHNYGTYIVLAALFASAANQYAKKKGRNVEE